MIGDKKRFDWVDVARGFALIFVYLGHWITARVEMFAYSFHLQLLFIIAGFFCCTENTKISQFITKKICSIAVPLFLWSCISFVIARFDAEEFSLSELKVLICDPGSVQPNYWFLPALLSVAIVYSLIYIYMQEQIYTDVGVLGVAYVVWRKRNCCGGK